jgi:hypothetical protein
MYNRFVTLLVQDIGRDHLMMVFCPLKKYNVHALGKCVAFCTGIVRVFVEKTLTILFIIVEKKSGTLLVACVENRKIP